MQKTDIGSSKEEYLAHSRVGVGVAPVTQCSVHSGNAWCWNYGVVSLASKCQASNKKKEIKGCQIGILDNDFEK